MTEKEAESTVECPPDREWKELWVLGFTPDQRAELHMDNIESVLAKEAGNPWWKMRRWGTTHPVQVLCYDLYASRRAALSALKTGIELRIRLYQSNLRYVQEELNKENAREA